MGEAAAVFLCEQDIISSTEKTVPAKVKITNENLPVKQYPAEERKINEKSPPEHKTFSGLILIFKPKLSHV